MSNISIMKTSLALELVNSSLQVTESNIDAVNFALISGLNYNMLDVHNSQIVCSDNCIRVGTSNDMIMKITNSSITSTYNGIIINNVERLQFDLTETLLKSSYNYLLNLGNEIKSGIVQIFKSTFMGINLLVSGNTVGRI